MSALEIGLAMPPGGPVEPGAIWVGLLDTEQLGAGAGSPGVPDAVRLLGAEAYARARLLVRTGGAVRGYVTPAIVGDTADAAALRDLVDALPEVEPIPAPAGLPEPVSVVICTRDRPELLRSALESVLAMPDDDFEVVVVDNAPSTEATRELVDALGDARVRYVRELVPGLATARNTGLAAARHELVAFTDDDVLVEARWLRVLRAAFAADPEAACVTGLVPSGELRNAVQQYFDARVSWSKITRRTRFHLASPPAGLPMFPFCVGEYGTGANFALRRSVAGALGGFDPRLGVGTRTRGGEDIDMFVRILLAGHALVVEPSAIVWHRHRADLAALRSQAIGYGTGLGAWLTKLASSPRTLGMALRRSPTAVVRLVRKPMTTVDDDAPSGAALPDVGRTELLRVLAGPAAYLRESAAVRRRGVGSLA